MAQVAHRTSRKRPRSRRHTTSSETGAWQLPTQETGAFPAPQGAVTAASPNGTTPAPHRLSGHRGQAAWVMPLVVVLAPLALLMPYSRLALELHSVGDIPVIGWVVDSLWLLVNLGYAIAVGYAVGGAGWISHCRDLKLMRHAGVAAAGMATYAVFTMLVWLDLHLALGLRWNASTLGQLIWPPALLDLTSSVLSLIPVDTLLNQGLILVIIFWTTREAASRLLRNAVFCERCDHWCEEQASALLAPPIDPKLSEKISSGELDSLKLLPPATAEDPQPLELLLKTCSTCKFTATAQVRRRKRVLGGLALFGLIPLGPQVEILEEDGFQAPWCISHADHQKLKHQVVNQANPFA